MSWSELISEAYEARDLSQGIRSKPTFFGAATPDDIGNVETQLNAIFPSSLRALFRESNGVMDMLSIDGGEWFANMWLLWNTDEIANQNTYLRAEQERRPHKQEFEKLLFFADAGADGVLFAFPVESTGDCMENVLVWHPINDDVTGIAPSLAEFIDGWISGSITV